jgi:ribosomal protein L7/L12
MSQISCPNCGASVESTERACSYCGAALSAAPVSSSAPTVRVSRAEVEALASSSADPLQAVREQVERGNKIEAIRLYREATGVGLKEAKDAVEAMEGGQAVMASAATVISSGPLLAFGSSAEAMDAIKAELRGGNKIKAIQLHREYFSSSLAEAKTAVDQIEGNLRFETVVSRVDADVPDFARPNAPSVEPVLSANPFDEPKKSGAPKWVWGCAAAAVLFCCLCILLPAALYWLTQNMQF